MDASSRSKYSEPDAELQAILAASPPIPSFATYPSAEVLRSSIQAQFAAMIQAGLFTPVSWASNSVSEISIPTRDGSSVRAKIYKNDSTVSDRPVFVYFHGGGWTFGFPESGERYFEPLVKELGVVVVAVAYRLAPEHRFPTAALDGVDVVRWVASNAASLGGDVTKGFIVSGASAGGNVAAVAAHQAVEDGLTPAITGVVLCYPSLCHEDGVPEDVKEHCKSYTEFEDAVVLDRKAMRWFYDQYQPDPKSPLASPLRWETHKGQPKTYIQAMGMDPLRDEALIYEHLLRENGTKTKLDVFPGIPHGAPDFFPMHSSAGKAVEGVKNAVQWILE